nr:probable methyltransferase PMT24 [Tanacetum cinerariifolium]
MCRERVKRNGERHMQGNILRTQTERETFPAESLTCLVALPKGYKISIRWPRSRYQIWYNNVPQTKVAEVKGHQN